LATPRASDVAIDRQTTAHMRQTPFIYGKRRARRFKQSSSRFAVGGADKSARGAGRDVPAFPAGETVAERRSARTSRTARTPFQTIVVSIRGRRRG